MPVTVMPKLPTVNSVLIAAGARAVGKENPDTGVEEEGNPADWLLLIIRDINASQAL